MGVCDIPIPDSKAGMIDAGHEKVEAVKKQYEAGIITDGERKSKVITTWTEVTDKISDELFASIQQVKDCQMNPLFMMLDSGARGNKSQVNSLVL